MCLMLKNIIENLFREDYIIDRFNKLIVRAQPFQRTAQDFTTL